MLNDTVVATGEGNDVKISNCWFDGTVAMTGDNGRYAGGIASTVVQRNVAIENCLFTGTISMEYKVGGMHVGGILGFSFLNSCVVNMKDCLSAGTIDVDYHVAVGSLVGRVQGGTVNITDCYATNECYKNGSDTPTTVGLIGGTCPNTAWNSGQRALPLLQS